MFRFILDDLNEFKGHGRLKNTCTMFRIGLCTVKKQLKEIRAFSLLMDGRGSLWLGVGVLIWHPRLPLDAPPLSWLQVGCRFANSLPPSAFSCLVDRQCLCVFPLFPSSRQVTSNPQVAGSSPAGRTTSKTVPFTLLTAGSSVPAANRALPACSAFRSVFKNLSQAHNRQSQFSESFDVSFRLFQKQILPNTS